MGWLVNEEHSVTVSAEHVITLQCLLVRIHHHIIAYDRIRHGIEHRREPALLGGKYLQRDEHDRADDYSYQYFFLLAFHIIL